MIYNLRRYGKKLFALTLAVLILFVVLASDCLALEEGTAEYIGDESALFLEALLSDGGGCIEVTLGSSNSACGVLAKLSYDPERLSFLTFAKCETLSDGTTVSCFDSGGDLRVLIDADENFEGTWCRFFFSVNETTPNETTKNKLLSEITVSTVSAYEKSESGYRELFFDDATVLLDTSDCVDGEQSEVDRVDSVSMQWIDFESTVERGCAVCISGITDRNTLAAGFEITVSCENITESYTAYRILPFATENDREYTVILLLPSRDSFYVTVRELGYSGKSVIVGEKTYCFFACGSNIERVGSD